MNTDRKLEKYIEIDKNKKNKLIEMAQTSTRLRPECIQSKQRRILLIKL